MYKELVVIFLSLFFALSVKAQDTVQLYGAIDEVVIVGKEEQMFSNINVTQIPSAVLQQESSRNLEETLSRYSSVNVTAYGASGISSIKMRGGQSQHTAVLWNGFRIVDPLLGEYNLSTSSTMLIDEIKVQKGGGSAVYGGGAVGGTLHLNNNPSFASKDKIEFQSSQGSFGRTYIGASVQQSKQKFYSKTSVFKHHLDNNFEYINVVKIGKPVEEYKHSKIDQYGVMHQSAIKLGNHQIVASYWWQDNEREVPATMLTSNPQAEMKDYFHRGSLQWQGLSKRWKYEAKTGLFYANRHYVDPQINLVANHASIASQSEGQVTYQSRKKEQFLQKHESSFGVNHSYTQGISEQLDNEAMENRTAVYYSEKIALKKWETNISFRREFINELWKPITFVLNSKYNLTKRLSINGSYSKSHSTPTFNDLFWVGVGARGNPELLDESSQSGDIGISHQLENGKFSLSAFRCSYNDMIQWMPEGGVWMPQNQKKVLAQGIEVEFNNKYSITPKVSLTPILSYAYTSSIVKEKSMNESDLVLDKQIIYTPMHRANSSVVLNVQKWRFDGSLNYFGKQYTRADNREFLFPGELIDVGVSYQLLKDGLECIVHGKIRNLFNEVYMVRIWYPMPGRNYEIGLKIKLK